MARIRLLFGINIFWLALSMLNDSLTTLVLPVRLAAQVPVTQQATALGLVTFAGLIAGMLLQPLAGRLSDQWRASWGRRSVLAVGVVLIMIGLAVFAMNETLGVMLAAYLLIQVAASVAQAAQQGFLPDQIHPSQRGTASGLKGLMDLGGALLGFAVLGTLLGQGQIQTAVLAIAVVTAITFGLTLILVHEPSKPVSLAPSRFSLQDTLRLDVREHRAFLWLVAARFLFLLGTYAVGRFFLYFIADRLHLDREQAADQAAGVLAGLTLLAALGAPVAGWAADRLGRLPPMLIGALLSAIGVWLLAGAGSPATIFLYGGLTALGSAAFVGANWAFTADLVPPGEAARFFALANFGTAGAVAAAGLFGLLVDSVNAASPGAGYLALFIVSGLIFLLSAAAWASQRATGVWVTPARKRTERPV